VSFTKGRIIVRGKIVKRGKAKRADYILYYKPNIPLAVIEAKDNHSSVGDGLQQALEYAETLQLPFVFSSNGDGFVFHDRTETGGQIERNLTLGEFPSPALLWARYRTWKGLPEEADALVLQDYYSEGTDRGPRYYQATAVNAAIEGPKAYLIAGKSWVNNHAHVFRGVFVSHQFLVHYLNAFDYSGRVAGATRSKLNQAKALDIPIMLPPLNEQREIVTKVGELMALCDRLEAARAEREAKRDKLTVATLARLNSPDPDRTRFAGGAHFALDILPTLTARRDQIQQLRQAFLNLAIRGKLVPQDESDEPAGEFLKRIAVEKKHQGKAREGKKVEPAPMDSGEFPLPARWALAPLDALCTSITDGDHLPPPKLKRESRS
jgi:hypothetical protein